MFLKSQVISTVSGSNRIFFVLVDFCVCTSDMFRKRQHYEVSRVHFFMLENYFSAHQHIRRSVHQYNSTSTHPCINSPVAAHQHICTSAYQHNNISAHHHCSTSGQQHISTAAAVHRQAHQCNTSARQHISTSQQHINSLAHQLCTHISTTAYRQIITLAHQ